MSSRKILGIDPGSLSTGYGIIKTPPLPSPSPQMRDPALAGQEEGYREGSSDRIAKRSEAHLVICGCLKNKQKIPFSFRFLHIYEGLEEIIARYQPDEVAIESIFYHKNVRSALLMGEVRGVALLACQKANLPIFEYSPLEIKQSVVGTGSASKKQIQFMVKTLLRLKESPAEDAADALAVALCHLHRSRSC
ncbi:MAG: crossover junction endodeoxyribonuclease RuvC [Candidatus Edwardsbacteria bacterium]